VKNQLHALAMGEGVCRKKKLFTAKGRKELEGLSPYCVRNLCIRSPERELFRSLCETFLTRRDARRFVDQCYAQTRQKCIISVKPTYYFSETSGGEKRPPSHGWPLISQLRP